MSPLALFLIKLQLSALSSLVSQSYIRSNPVCWAESKHRSPAHVGNYKLLWFRKPPILYLYIISKLVIRRKWKFRKFHPSLIFQEVRYYIKYLLLFFQMNFCIKPCSLLGNSVNFKFNSQKEGLSNNYVQCCFQDKRGFMWFGTSQGLNRFDGYRFTRLVNSPDDSTFLVGNLVRV